MVNMKIQYGYDRKLFSQASNLLIIFWHMVMFFFPTAHVTFLFPTVHTVCLCSTDPFQATPPCVSIHATKEKGSHFFYSRSFQSATSLYLSPSVCATMCIYLNIYIIII